MAPALDVGMDDLPPPPQPPRLLSDDQIIQFARQGHFPLPLPKHLASLYSHLDAVSDDFFALPLDAKQSLYPPNGQSELGFVSIPGEKDYVTFRSHTSQDQQSHLEHLVASVWAETFHLFRRILSDLAYGLNLPHEIWNDILDGTNPMPVTLDTATPTFLRIFRYAADKGIAEQHTDMGLLTLCVCQGKGLQVLTRNTQGTDTSETWTEYSEPTLLIGQTLTRLSGGLLRSGIHRVLPNTDGRGSIVFALRPNTKREIDLRAFPGARNQNQGMVHLGDLWKSIWSRAYNVNAPKDVREKQKQNLRLNQNRAVGYQQVTSDGGHDDITNTRAAFEV